jgi:hypothetical protein
MAGDIVGYDDMIGADDLDSLLNAVRGGDIVGAASRGGKQKVSAASLPVSFVGVPVTVLSTSQSVIQVPIQRAIRPDRFVIDRVQAATIDVVDIKVGTVSLNASVNPVPGDCFAPDAMGTAIRAVVTAIPAVGIQLTVKASTGTPSLRAAFFGPSMPG